MGDVEQITLNGKPLAYVIRGDMNPERTHFLTPPEFNTQIGFIVYPAGSEVTRHVHLPLERHIVGTYEVLVIKKGRCLIDLYNGERELVATRELKGGDVILLVVGGHGIRMLEDTVFLEIKQGPYIGMEEKERF
jgi:hypothetical protein